MRKSLAVLICAVTVACAVPAIAELQNVQVGGSIRIRGSYYTSSAILEPDSVRNPLIEGVPPLWSMPPYANNNQGLRWLASPGRAAVASLAQLVGRTNAVSGFSWSDDGHANKYVEQRTRLNVKADFTDAVSAFIELDSYDTWGEDFRSNYLTGIDGAAATGDDVEVYQAYIEANDMFDYPLRLRVGRQELMLGSGWLVGTNDASSGFTGLSFDAVTLTYATDMLSVTGLAAKLAENGPVEEDGDVDMYGVYASYLGVEDMTLDAYWLFVRDAVELRDTPYDLVGNWVEEVLGVDDYDATTLHTVGLRGAGMYGAFDYEAEVAYQFGDAGVVGVLNRTLAVSPYGDDDAEWDAWACNIEVGYTFDIEYAPRVYLGFAYFDGQDDRDITFWEWLAAQACPFWKGPDPSVSFNRLFSNWEYSEFLDATDLSNAWIGRGGVSVMPMEDVTVLLTAAYYQAVDCYDVTWPNFFLLGNRFTPLAPYSFITEENDDDLGWELGLYVTYDYSEDLTFELGWAHLFVGDGLEDGNFNSWNGLAFNGGIDNDDADYVYLETKLCF